MGTRGAGISCTNRVGARSVMTRFLFAVILTTLVLGGQSQEVKLPEGWSGGPPGTIFVDHKVVHRGRSSTRLERRAQSPSGFSSFSKSIPIDFSGASVELRGFLRTEDVSGFAGLWMREDGETPEITSLAFDNMDARQLRGTTPWTRYSITLPIHEEAKVLFFGALVSGTGKAWADDLQLLVDGKSVSAAPKIQNPKTPLDLDHEFDSGSGVVIEALSAVQIQNLATLGKVWGFLKYHHPQITAGQRHWDYDLFRALPAILNAQDRVAADAALLRWILNLGDIAPCKPCATLEQKDLNFGPELDWITNAPSLGADLSKILLSIRDNRVPGNQFYVTIIPNIGNPLFRHELGYDNLNFPDAGFQLLGLYRFWNIFEYWSPYRDLAGPDWNRALTEFIPRIALARNAESYQRESMALMARAQDGHANLWSSLEARPPVGKCRLPIEVRYIENVPVIGGIPAAAASVSPVRIGDVITELDGIPVAKLVESWKPYYVASNEAARFRDIGRYLPRGECGESGIKVRRDSQDLQLTMQRTSLPFNDLNPGTHDLPGPAFRLLSKDVAYLKLSSVKAADAIHYIEQAAGTKGLIIDIRNYPSEFMVHELGSHLVEKEVAFVRFTRGDLSNPGAFHWTQPMSLDPEKPHYSGKVVILVDETSMSQAEFTCMAFRAARGAIVVGSATSGADGNVSRFALPGGLPTMISGIGVFYPDKTPTQRIGIVPDVEVKPTIAGVRAGRDEVLDEALRQIVANH
jgi:C-terminal processing protease CtpA/Prc